MSFTLTIIGRPNVGKSTLFNRLAGKRLALVDDTPGVTRDRREGEGTLMDLDFRLLDTAGLEDAEDDTLEGRMRLQTERAVAESDVALLVIDARAGITPMDEHFAQWIRTQPVPVVLVANKCDGPAQEAGRLEAFGLGLGEPVGVSAEHGLGMSDLADALRPFAEAAQAAEEAEAWQDDQANPDGPGTDLNSVEDLDDENDDGIIQLAIAGRPNVGKSTLINRLLDDDRMLTGPEAGITRDAIAIDWTFKGRPFRLVDTAGLRRRSKVVEKLESLGAKDTIRAIQYAQVVVLVLDANAAMEKQDLTIARKVIEEGRALVIAINKWDAAKDRKEIMADLVHRLEHSLPQVRGIPVVTFSALTGRGVDKLLPAVLKTYDTWNTRVTTANLNRWLDFMTEAHPPPLAKTGKRLRLRYMTQAKTRPPTFVIFSSRADEIPESYKRYLVNGLRDEFGLDGVPVRVMTRKGDNPYAR